MLAAPGRDAQFARHIDGEGVGWERSAAAIPAIHAAKSSVAVSE